MKQKLSLVVSKINHYLAVGSRMHITKNSFLLKKEFLKIQLILMEWNFNFSGFELSK